VTKFYLLKAGMHCMPCIHWSYAPASESNPKIRRVPTAQTVRIGRQKHVDVIHVLGMEWSELTKLTASSNHYQARWRKNTLMFLNIICCDEVEPKYKYSADELSILHNNWECWNLQLLTHEYLIR